MLAIDVVRHYEVVGSGKAVGLRKLVVDLDHARQLRRALDVGRHQRRAHHFRHKQRPTVDSERLITVGAERARWSTVAQTGDGKTQDCGK